MLRLYWKNATGKVVGPENGITPTDLTSIEGSLKKAHEAVVAASRQGKLGYAALPANTDYCQQVKTLVDRYKDNTTDMVLLGIGRWERATALGPRYSPYQAM